MIIWLSNRKVEGSSPGLRKGRHMFRLGCVASSCNPCYSVGLRPPSLRFRWQAMSIKIRLPYTILYVPSLFLRQSLKGSFVFKDIVNIFFPISSPICSQASCLKRHHVLRQSARSGNASCCECCLQRRLVSRRICIARARPRTTQNHNHRHLTSSLSPATYRKNQEKLMSNESESILQLIVWHAHIPLALMNGQ